MAKKGVVMYYDLLEQLQDFTDEQFGKITRAMIKYDRDGIEPQFNDIQIKLAFNILKPTIDRNKQEYQEKCDKNRENINKRWKKQDTNEYDCIRMNTNYTDIDIDKDKEIDKEIDKDNNKKEIYKEKVEQSPTHTQTLKEEKHKYGEYNHVLLTDKELNRLKDEIGEKNTESAIKLLDEAIEMKGYKYKSHYLAIKKWVLTSLKQQGKWVDVPVKSVRVITAEEEKARKELDEKFKNDPNAEKEFAEFMKSRKLNTNIFKEF